VGHDWFDMSEITHIIGIKRNLSLWKRNINFLLIEQRQKQTLEWFFQVNQEIFVCQLMRRNCASFVAAGD